MYEIVRNTLLIPIGIGHGGGHNLNRSSCLMVGYAGERVLLVLNRKPCGVLMAEGEENETWHLLAHTACAGCSQIRPAGTV